MAVSCLPIAYLFLPYRLEFGLSMAGLAAIAWLVDRNRHRNWIRVVFQRWFAYMLRPGEIEGRLTGATWGLFGIVMAVVLFPVEIASLAILFMTVCDPVAGIVGQRWGRTKLFSKSLEGSLAGLTAGILIGLPVPGVGLYLVISGAVTAMVIELLPLPVNDNFSIPVVTGAVMTLAGGFGQ